MWQLTTRPWPLSTTPPPSPPGLAAALPRVIPSPSRTASGFSSRNTRWVLLPSTTVASGPLTPTSRKGLSKTSSAPSANTPLVIRIVSPATATATAAEMECAASAQFRKGGLCAPALST